MKTTNKNSENSFGNLGKGAYTICEVSRFTGVSWSRVRHWVRGDLRYPTGIRTPVKPLISTDYGKVENKYELSFLQMIEIMMVNKLLQKGLSIQTIRKVYEQAIIVFKTRHPFATKILLTDGKKIFADAADEFNDKALINLQNRQYVFDEMTRIFLEEVETSAEGISIRWWPLTQSEPIVIDPARSFGQPIVNKEGVQTIILAQMVKVEGSVEKVSWWYDVDPKATKAAYEYETQKTRRLAA
ncbi:MAG: hypothetical protein NTW14_09285 [bacterium]|nr:hypothetical protein [bacterium]